MVIDIELSRLARANGTVRVHDVDLDDLQELSVGDEIDICDEGGHVHRARVEATRQVRFGTQYQLKLLDI